MSSETTPANEPVSDVPPAPSRPWDNQFNQLRALLEVCSPFTWEDLASPESFNFDSDSWNRKYYAIFISTYRTSKRHMKEKFTAFDKSNTIAQESKYHTMKCNSKL